VFQITPADDRPVEIIGFFLGQSSDFGDAQAEMLPYSVIRGHTTTGSGGTTVTARPQNRSGATAGAVVMANNTTQATVGTPVTMHADTFNVMAGEKLWIPDSCEWEASQADTTILIRLGAAPADALTMSGTIYFREQG
jgi:hypothetical protein